MNRGPSPLTLAFARKLMLTLRRSATSAVVRRRSAFLEGETAGERRVLGEVSSSSCVKVGLRRNVPVTMPRGKF